MGSIAIFAEFISLPRQLGIYEFLARKMHDEPELAFIALPVFLIFLFGPIYAAAWFFRLCHRLAYPVPEWATKSKRPKTRATRWLVWFGVLMMVLPPMVEMLQTFNRITISASCAGFP